MGFDIGELRVNMRDMGVPSSTGEPKGMQLEGTMTPGMVRDQLDKERRSGETLGEYSRRTGYIPTGHNTGFSPTGPSR